MWVFHFYQQATAVSYQQQKKYYISRLSFGITPQQIATINTQSLEDYIQAQLNPSSIPESSKLTTQLAKFDTIEQQSLNLFKTFQQYNNQLEENSTATLSLEAKQQLRDKRNQHKSKIIRQARQAHIIRAIASNRQLQEVMTNFWLNHFNVFAAKKIVAFWLADYENDLRDRALGNFRDLLAVTAHHPAMLVYLDNNLNTNPNRIRKQGNAKGINENYARELMELHTLGVDGGYTQQDVTNLARIFTGWGVDIRGNYGDANNFRFFKRLHDPTDKIFLGQTIISSGMAEGEQALDILANHPATARFISYKLAQYFVADTPPKTLVDKLTKTFLASQGNIKTVLETLFHSSEFNDPNYYKAKFKTPFQYLVSIVRASNIKNPELKKIEWMLNQLAMPIFGCEAPNGYQNTESAWLNPDAMLRRVSYATNIARGALSNQQPLDFTTLQTTLGNDLTAQTQQTIADSHPNLKAALILGSPEMMYR
ncbi:DUF1800 domain-containing protein [Hyella patelloides]|uniref:DUF1800 domain-containing protein n=1 Tax=Hyella patelloides TaxID=1982969 RepID=UPI001FE9402E|nr:DUF1800 domain-containing protein [Hyella patelloides]